MARSGTFKEAGVIAMLLLLLFVQLAVHAAAEPGFATMRTQKRVADCTLESRNIDDCDPVAYAIRVAIFTAPGIVISIFYLLCCPVYCMAKYCCNCCGGRGQSPNFCCPNESLPARYSTGDILRPKVFTLLCFLVALGTFIWGMVAVNKLTDGLSGAGNAIEGVPDVLGGIIDEIDEALTVERYDADTDTTSSESLLGGDGSGGSLKENADSLKDDLDKMVSDVLGDYQEYVDRAKSAMYVFFVLPAVLIALGGLGAIFNIRKFLPMTMVWLLFLIGFLLWFGHAMFCMTSMVFGDVCAEIHGISNQQLNVITPLIGCEDSQFDDFRTTFKELEEEQAEETCREMQELCFNDQLSAEANLDDGNIFLCPQNLQCVGKNFADLVVLTETGFFIHPDIQALPDAESRGATCVGKPSEECFISTCSDLCREGATIDGPLSSFGRSSKQVYVNFLAARAVSNAFDTIGAKFSTCDSVFSIIISPLSPPCDDLTTGSVGARQASGLLGLCTLAAIFIFAWGSKRYISIDEADKPQMESCDVQEFKQGELA